MVFVIWRLDGCKKKKTIERERFWEYTSNFWMGIWESRQKSVLCDETEQNKIEDWRNHDSVCRCVLTFVFLFT